MGLFKELRLFDNDMHVSESMGVEYAEKIGNIDGSLTITPDKIGDITQLTTNDKSSLVNAINENTRCRSKR